MVARPCAAVVATVAGLAAVAWFAIGDLSSPVTPGTRQDYIVGPVTTPWWGLVPAALVLAIGLAGLVHAYRARRLGGPHVAALLTLGAVAVAIAFGGRVITAGGIGANIGGGLMLLFGFPVLGALLVVGAVLLWRAHRRDCEDTGRPRRTDDG